MPSTEKSAHVFVHDSTTRRVLVVKGRNGWMLPGGFVDRGETAFDAAQREMWEESGFKQIYVKLEDNNERLHKSARFFRSRFDFGALGHGGRKTRQQIFKTRGTPRETMDYGFARWINKTNPKFIIEEYGGTRKEDQTLRRGCHPNLEYFFKPRPLFFKPRPNHALWLVPTEESLARVIAQDRDLQMAVEALARSGKWGGQVHITLTSFAGDAGWPDSWDNKHGCRLAAAAKQLANSSAQRVSLISATPWAGGGRWGRSATRGSDTAYYKPEQSRTLKKLAEGLKATTLRNPRAISDFHVTFRAMSQFPECLPALGTLEWEIAVVQDLHPDDQDHRGISIKDRERFVLLSTGKGSKVWHLVLAAVALVFLVFILFVISGSSFMDALQGRDSGSGTPSRGRGRGRAEADPDRLDALNSVLLSICACFCVIRGRLGPHRGALMRLGLGLYS